jgi:eukaryotic-like serine/threonine-protein kinase
MVWAIGRSLKGGQYQVEKVLHQGHLSVTYEAKSLQGHNQGHKVVIKTPSDAAISQADFDKLQQRFVAEAFKLVKCQKSPYIVQVEEPFQEDGLWCIPMEYIAGMTLDRRSPMRLPEAEAIRYVQQVGQALEVLHAERLIHRDVAPNNIILRSRNGVNEAVLIDFGLVRDFTLSNSVTSTQKVTPYTARELCTTKQERGVFTDLYGLGAVLYSLVTGQEPPMAMDRSEDELKFPPGVSSGVEAVIQSAMKIKGIDRPSSVSVWLEQVNQLAIGNSSEAPKPLPPKPEEDREKMHKRRIETWQVVAAIITAIGGLMAGVGAMMSANKSDSPKPTPSVSQVATPSGGPVPMVSPKRSP